MSTHVETRRGDQLGVADRREAPAVTLEIDPDPRKLRQSIALLEGTLRELEAEPARRVRLLVSEIVARSAGGRNRARGSICLEISVGASRVRLEVWGPALLTPSETDESDRKTEPLFPYWALEGLADRWGLDRRSRTPAMWFEICRD